MKVMDFDRTASSAPLNREASVARDGSGDLWDVRIPADYSHWKAPPLPTEKLAPGKEDLAGRVLGRLTVIRFHGRSGKSTPTPVWLVRCVCGDYEVRRHETILKAAEPNDACYVCRAVDRLRIQGSKPNTKRRRKRAAAMLDQLAAASRKVA